MIVLTYFLHFKPVSWALVLERCSWHERPFRGESADVTQQTLYFSELLSWECFETGYGLSTCDAAFVSKHSFDFGFGFIFVFSLNFVAFAEHVFVVAADGVVTHCFILLWAYCGWWPGRSDIWIRLCGRAGRGRGCLGAVPWWSCGASQI